MEEELKMKEEQTFQDNPEIQIEYADDISIHNCLSLPSLDTVGPANDVPALRRGKKKVLDLLVVSNM